jgi:hypothetical protein
MKLASEKPQAYEKKGFNKIVLHRFSFMIPKSGIYSWRILPTIGHDPFRSIAPRQRALASSSGPALVTVRLP